METKEQKDKCWNGGTTNKYNEMIRESEDYYDTIDSEVEFREDLVERERLMREQDKENPPSLVRITNE